MKEGRGENMNIASGRLSMVPLPHCFGHYRGLGTISINDVQEIGLSDCRQYWLTLQPSDEDDQTPHFLRPD